MVILNGHFDGSRVVFDEPLPRGIQANTPVRIIFDALPPESLLSKVASLAIPGEMPPDFAQQHEHYIKGTEKR